MLNTNFLLVVVFLGGAFGVVWLSKVVYKDLFSPLSVFVGANLASLALWHFKLFELVGLSNNVYLILMLSIVAFWLGAVLVAPECWLTRKEKQVPQDIQVSNKIINKIYWGVVAISTIGWISQLWLFVEAHGVLAIWTNPYSLQKEFQVKYLGYLNLIGALALPVYVLLHKKKTASWVTFFGTCAAFIGLLLAGIKSYLIMSLVMSFFVYTVTSNQRRQRAALLYGIGIVLILLGFFVLYDNVVDVYDGGNLAAANNGIWLDSISRPYIYLVGGWSGFSVITERSTAIPHVAYFSLSWLWKILGSWLHFMDPVPDYSPFSEVGENVSVRTNVYTFIGSLYWGIGPIGAVSASMFWGVVSTKLYVLARKKRTIGLVLISSLIMYCLFLSFFTYYFRFNILFLAVVIFLLTALAKVSIKVKRENVL